MPKEYTAITKVSDEYKDTEFSNSLLPNPYSSLKFNANKSNSGMDDIDVYYKNLLSEDFVRTISHKMLPQKGMTYGEYIHSEDTIEEIRTKIKYNYRSKMAVLTLAFTDKDPVIAAQMLDSVLNQLQTTITTRRRNLANQEFDDAKKNMLFAKGKYHDAQTTYANYIDTHSQIELQSELQKRNYLENEIELAYKNYEDAVTEYTRQKSYIERETFSFATVKAITIPTEPDTHLVGYLLSFVIISLLLTKAWKLFKKKNIREWHIDFGDISSPWTITVIVWSIIIFAISVNDITEPLSHQFWVSFILWMPIFIVSSFLSYNLLEGSVAVSKDVKEQLNKKIFYVFFFLLVLMTPMYLYQTYKMVIMFDTKDLMLNVRMLALEGEGHGLLEYARVIQNATLLVSLWCFPKVKWWQLFFIFFAGLLIAVSNMEKMGFFMIFICSVYVAFERKVLKAHSIGILMVALLIVFYSFNLARSGENSSYSENESLLDFIGMYIMSGSVAYGHLHEGVGNIFGQNTLSGFYAYFYKWAYGMTMPFVPGDYKEGIFVPMFTNVYTVFSTFFVDFGQKGVAFFAMIYGVISGVVYRYSRGGSLFAKCLYTYILYLLVLQFFEEIMFLAFPFFAQLILLLYLMTQKSFSLRWKK